MEDFQDLDIGSWQLRSGLMSYAAMRVRNFARKPRKTAVRASITLSLLASVSTLAVASSTSLSQVQEKWPVAGLSQPAPLRDLSLVPGSPETYWRALMSEIDTWRGIEEPGTIDDVPPLL